MTDKYASKIMKVVNDEYKNINQVIDKINKIENKIKFKVFGKTKLKVKQSKVNNDKNINEKNEILLNVQAKKIENEIQRIKQLKQGRATNVFKLRDVINGPKKAAQDPVAFKNQDGELIVHPEQIMKYTLNYVKDNLSQNYPDILNEETILLRRKKQYDNIFQCNSVIQDDDFSVNEDDFF